MVKRVLTSIITVAVLMGVLVACGGSQPVSLSLEEKIYYTNNCDFDCQVWVEILANTVFEKTEKEKQDYIYQFSTAVECWNDLIPERERTAEFLKDLGDDWKSQQSGRVSEAILAKNERDCLPEFLIEIIE